MNQEILVKRANQIKEKHPSEDNSDIIDKKNDEKVITAVGESKYFCVGIVDIVNSTKTVAKLLPNEIPKYYEIFLNNMAKTVISHQGEILKIMGDSLLFYFPENYPHYFRSVFLNAIECGFSMMAMHEDLNRILKRHTLPPIDFRISFDYGNLTIMKTRNGLFDLVGPTINTCSKINNLAPINSTVIGRDFHDKIKNFHQYVFQNTGKFSIDLKQSYPIFTINRKNG